MSVSEDQKGVSIVYDGECPFCSRYVELLRLRSAFGRVELIDARSDHPLAQEARSMFDLDEGMAALLAGTWYHGADCMHVLSLASSGSSIVNRGVAAIFTNQRRARALYPWLRTGRNVTLRLLGRQKIHKQS
jgi:predicted DCC family thiol-disulfide oxidoreductase YuxK